MRHHCADTDNQSRDLPLFLIQCCRKFSAQLVGSRDRNVAACLPRSILPCFITVKLTYVDKPVTGDIPHDVRSEFVSVPSAHALHSSILSVR